MTSSLTRRETAQALLTSLVHSYARPESLVGSTLRLSELPTLRALEHAGLVEIKTVVLEKRWVVTAAGALWLALIDAGFGGSLHLDRDILCSRIGFWMTRAEGVEGMMRLRREGLCRITAPSGAPSLDPCQGEVLLYLEDGDPLHALPRYLKEEEAA